MSLLIGFLTFILVLICLLLILLVLVQLPKKEAGIGMAFGGGATDALFGAGSGNALTKMTKYATGFFLGLALVLAVLNAQKHQSAQKSLEQELSRKSTAAPMITPPPRTTTPVSSNQGTLGVTPNAGSLSNSAQPLQLPAATPANTAPATNSAK
jgi:preprotein translocase subunit SecG